MHLVIGRVLVACFYKIITFPDQLSIEVPEKRAKLREKFYKATENVVIKVKRQTVAYKCRAKLLGGWSWPSVFSDRNNAESSQNRNNSPVE
ncbi:MAG: hypothetical protein KGI29_06040 [Pseudomonadota bacterium]|nr:hypothetical protein [Pseudomonadota bacterium]MDE3037403.1 hypothetical protein [Pseudomonadota bacterium]